MDKDYLIRIAPPFNSGTRTTQLVTWADSAIVTGHPKVADALKGLAYLVSGGGTCLPSIRRFVANATVEELAPWVLWLAESLEKPEDVPGLMATSRSINPKLVVALP